MKGGAAGQLDATITFADADGAQTVFDLHYPADYNAFHDGIGPLWLANWRHDLVNGPQVSPVLGNSCLQTINRENLAPSLRYRSAYNDYIVCRVLDEEGPNAPGSYDITQAKPAVIGVIWASRNHHQPMDIPRERCVAEARIWSTEIAKPEDRFLACIFVAKSATEMRRIREKSKDSEARPLYRHISKLVCGSNERAALLAFQENSATYTYDLNRKDGRPMAMFATFPNLPC